MDIAFFDITFTKIIFGIFLVLIYVKLGMLLTNQHLYINDATNFYSQSYPKISASLDALNKISSDFSDMPKGDFDERFKFDLMQSLRKTTSEIEKVRDDLAGPLKVDVSSLEEKIDEVISTLNSIQHNSRRDGGRDPDLPDWVG